MHATLPLLKATDFPAIRRHAVQTLQVNLGYTCNLSCNHCHVNAGPNRREQMERANIDLVLVVYAARPTFNRWLVWKALVAAHAAEFLFLRLRGWFPK